MARTARSVRKRSQAGCGLGKHPIVVRLEQADAEEGDDIVDAFDLTGGVAGTELHPDGGFMNDTLNLAANVSTESSNASQEASVVVVTHNFYDAGEWKAALPDGTGEAIGHIQQDVGVAAEGLAAYIELNYPDDDHMLDVADHLTDVGEDFLFADEAYCESVSGPG